MPKSHAQRKPVPNHTVQPATRKVTQGKPPGSQSSDATGRGKDERNGHDKDGNEAQRQEAAGPRQR